MLLWAVGFADKAVEGKHHCRSTRFHSVIHDLNYLKDVSPLFAMIRSVWEYNIEMHLEGERALLS